MREVFRQIAFIKECQKLLQLYDPNDFALFYNLNLSKRQVDSVIHSFAGDFTLIRDTATIFCHAVRKRMAGWLSAQLHQPTERVK